jgi:cyclopropane-fatty-acyl-phospholipid synthase
VSFAKKILFRTLHGLREGCLEMTLPGGTRETFGEPNSSLRAQMHVHDERFFSRLLWGGNDEGGDAYMDGDWTTPDLVAVCRLAVRNVRHLEQADSRWAWLSRFAGRLAHRARANTITGSRKNIAAHYDLSNDFFRLFLDENMLYSAAAYNSPEDSLEQAQVEKIDRLCRKLRLQPHDQLLEIGTGWGGFALHASRHYGCHVTTTTISQQQHDYAAARFSEAGDAGRRIRLLQQDYRKLTGVYDKICSIEMFEAVGLAHYDDFFGACDRLLKPDGVMAMQTITMNEQNFPAYVKQSDWIQKRIFPGGELASIAEIQKSLARCTRLGLIAVDEIGLHYAYTLEEWRRRFWAAVGEVRALGFDDRFIRRWDFYLGYCEAAFRERYIGDAQLVLAKVGTQRPLMGEPWNSAAALTGSRVRSAAGRGD